MNSRRDTFESTGGVAIGECPTSYFGRMRKSFAQAEAATFQRKRIVLVSDKQQTIRAAEIEKPFPIAELAMDYGLYSIRATPLDYGESKGA
jgi:hypothetical protein